LLEPGDKTSAEEAQAAIDPDAPGAQRVLRRAETRKLIDVRRISFESMMRKRPTMFGRKN
jgi:hypothetical protein